LPQIRLHFTAPRDAAAALYRSLEAEFEDDGLPLAIIEVDEATGASEVSLYAEADSDAEPRMRRILDGDGGFALGREILPEIDWVSHTLAGLKPVRAGRVLVHGAHDRDKRGASDVAIEIEAGLAFGTGHHGTTAGCLEMLQRVLARERPRNALDLGTGSAVLAIALAKLARLPVLATDIDPVATEVARSNVELNQAAGLVHCVTATGFHHPAFATLGPFELVVANILARPLMKLAPEMVRHVAPGGSLVLSGILERQRRAVLAAYVGQGFRHVATLHREGWSTLHLKR
jgi:ribosomal protein L11 methyltransferase